MTAPEHDPAVETWGLLHEWHWSGRLPLFGSKESQQPDMPDRWEGDDS